MNHAIEARRLLRACRFGSLATISKRLGGYPFVTIVPFMTDHDASAIILISRLAEHTKNIVADVRTSLMVHEAGPDVQSSARLTLSGECRRLTKTDEIAARYLRLFPSAAQLTTLDFDFYRIAPVAIRFIGGFGSIHWVAPASFTPHGDAVAAHEEACLRRINGEWAGALRDCCMHLQGAMPRECLAVALDCDGIDVRVDGALMRIPWPEPSLDLSRLESSLTRLGQTCRQ